jgi:membrane associated rhomboid family serine protease
MALQDRDYARVDVPPTRVVRQGGGGGFGTMRMWSVSTWLIVINVAVFVADIVFVVRTSDGFVIGRPFLWGHFSAATALYDLQLWRFITFQFLHADVAHLFFNMLSLYFFGGFIEQYLGSRRFLAFYLLCGVAGAVAYLLLWKMGVLISHPIVPMVGASAGIFGVLFAAAQVAPNTRVMLMFPPIPMRLRTLAWILIGIAVLTIVNSARRGGGGGNAGGEAAHLGGAALGALLIRYPQALAVFDLPFKRRRRERWGAERPYFKDPSEWN